MRYISLINAPEVVHGFLYDFFTSKCFLFNPFYPFLYPLKTLENLSFSNFFRGYRKRPVAWNKLTSDALQKSDLSEADHCNIILIALYLSTTNVPDWTEKNLD